MSAELITGIAIVGKNNEPIYLCDCANSKGDGAATMANGGDNNNNETDPFGFAETLSEQRCSLPLQLQLVACAALDSLDELLTTSGPANQQPVIKKPSASMPNWVGLLIRQDGQSVYGYVTATNIKFLALTNGRSEAKVVHAFLKEIHQHFIAYVMNPFSNTRGPVTSRLFDEQVRRSAAKVQTPEAVVD